MSIITPRLYLGDINNAKDSKFLQSKNIALIVNSAKEIPDFFEKIAGAPKYIRLNLNDVPEQHITDALKYASDAILHAIDHKANVFVHCAAGVSRSSSVVIYTIMRLYDWSFEKAYNFVKSMHPRTNPNSGFMKQLKTLDSKTLNTQQENPVVMPNNPLTKGEINDSKIIETSIDIEDPSMYGVDNTTKHQTSLTLDNDYARPEYTRKPKNSYTTIGR